MSPVAGRFIAIEGVDGAGKGVQSRALVAWLRARGIDVLLTREPGGSPGAEEIRQLLVNGEAERWDAMGELLLVYAARRSHLVQTVWPALARGQWVVSDRFADSSRAFQGVAGGLGLDTVDALHAMVVGDFEPDLTLVLDLDPETSLARTHARGGSEDRFEKKGLAYQRKVREGFRLVAGRGNNHVLVNAARTVGEVTDALCAIVQARLLSAAPAEHRG